MKIKIKKLHEDAVIPKYAKDGDAGMDLTAISENYEHSYVGGDNLVTYGTGLAFEIPKGYVGLLFPRSSVYKKDLTLSNSVGVLDSSYRGEVMFKFRANNHRRYSIGERIGQIIILPYPEIEFEEVQELCDTDRGDGGFGSTGS